MGVLDAISLRQLQAWEHLARNWPVFTDDAVHMRCAHCDLSIWRIEDNQGKRYEYTPAEVLALRVAHLRNHHPNLDPNEDTV